MDKIAFFLPCRKGSQRVKNKNTRNFAGIEGGLLAVKLSQLIKAETINEIILSTNDKECVAIASIFLTKCERIKIALRPNELCEDAANLQDLINYVPTITRAPHIVWGHVTTPLIDAIGYDRAVEMYFLKIKEGYDSLVGVLQLNNFLLNRNGKCINNTTQLSWPRTQDLEPLYQVNHSMFITSRETYFTVKNRIGFKPYLHTMDKFSSIDIDDEEDFAIAETIYNAMACTPPPPPI
jgi:N-acylneuraminate cytidylyltransferase